MPAKIDMIDKKFNRLTVLSESVADSHGQITYTCSCECGNIVEGIRGRDLRSGNTKSCGCLNKEKYVERINKNTVNHSNISYMKSKKSYLLGIQQELEGFVPPRENFTGLLSVIKGNKYI